MKKIFLLVALSVVCLSVSGFCTPPAQSADYMFFGRSSADNKQYATYSIYYDSSVGVKSMIIEVDYFSAGFTPGSGTTQNSSTASTIYTIKESENPKLYANVKDTLDRCMAAVNQVYPLTGSLSSAYMYFSFYSDSASGTNRKILGIRTYSR